MSNSTLNVTDIFQTDLLCTGHEDNLLKCSNNGIGTHMCPEDHSEDAGVKCNGNLPNPLKIAFSYPNIFKFHCIAYLRSEFPISCPRVHLHIVRFMIVDVQLH